MIRFRNVRFVLSCYRQAVDGIWLRDDRPRRPYRRIDRVTISKV